LPVGGIKEKLLAAYRDGIREAILPLDNRPDLKDLPRVIAQKMKIHLVEHMDEVFRIVLTKDLPQKAARKKKKSSPPSAPPRKGEMVGEGEEPSLTH